MKNKTNPILMVLVTAGVFGLGYYLGGTNMKVKMLEKNTQVGPTATVAPVDPLSSDNLKKYASELKLDQKKLTACMADKKVTDWITNSTKYGQEVGVLGTPNFFINGRLLGGAFPIEYFKEIIDKELKDEGSNDITTYSQYLQDVFKEAQTNNQPAPFNPEPANIEVKSDTPVTGNKDAKVTIVEFSDPSCPYCVKASVTVKQLLTDYKDKIRLAFYYFPGHGTGEEAMKAIYCAKNQNKFWEMNDKVFGAQAKAMGVSQ